MSVRTVTESIESDADPDAALGVLADAGRIPEWAPGFADSAERSGPTSWKMSKGGALFAMEVVVGREVRTVDYLREIAPGRKAGAYIRVLPRPGGGSVIVMTLPVPQDRTAQDVTAVLRKELQSLVKLVF